MKKIIQSIALLFINFPFFIAFANIYPIYEQPNNNSKIIEKFDENNQRQYIQFYRNGNWLKVANTVTGQVGWIDQFQVKETEAKIEYTEKLINLNNQKKYLENKKQAFDSQYNQISEQIDFQIEKINSKLDYNKTSSVSVN